MANSELILFPFGFERLFAVISFFHNNPVLMIIFGFGIFIFTGQLYKK